MPLETFDVFPNGDITDPLRNGTPGVTGQGFVSGSLVNAFTVAPGQFYSGTDPGAGPYMAYGTPDINGRWKYQFDGYRVEFDNGPGEAWYIYDVNGTPIANTGGTSALFPWLASWPDLTVTQSTLAAVLAKTPTVATSTVAGIVTLGGPLGAAQLNAQGELVGPLIPRLLLENSNDVPSVGELVSIVDSLTTPTWARSAVGNGLAIRGISRLDEPISVISNAAKLALSGLSPGQQVLITGEGKRLEQFTGGSINSDENWAVLRNTIKVNVENNKATSIIIEGVTVLPSTQIELGWFKEGLPGLVVGFDSYPSALFVFLTTGAGYSAYETGPLSYLRKNDELMIIDPIGPRAVIRLDYIG